MFATFNMGVGMVLVVAPEMVGQVLVRAEGASRIGRVVPEPGFRLV